MARCLELVGARSGRRTSRYPCSGGGCSGDGSITCKKCKLVSSKKITNKICCAAIIIIMIKLHAFVFQKFVHSHFVCVCVAFFSMSVLPANRLILLMLGCTPLILRWVKPCDGVVCHNRNNSLIQKGRFPVFPICV